jgi:hypothetical protein
MKGSSIVRSAKRRSSSGQVMHEPETLHPEKAKAAGLLCQVRDPWVLFPMG